MRPYWCLSCRKYNEYNAKARCDWMDRCKNIYDAYYLFIERVKSGVYKKKGITWSYSMKEAVYRAPYQLPEDGKNL